MTINPGTGILQSNTVRANYNTGDLVFEVSEGNYAHILIYSGSAQLSYGGGNQAMTANQVYPVCGEMQITATANGMIWWQYVEFTSTF